MIYQGVYLGPSPGQLTHNDLVKQQSQAYWQQQQQNKQEQVAGDLTIAPVVDHTGLVVGHKLTSKSAYADTPSSTFKSFAQRQSYGVCARVHGHDGGYEKQIQRAGHLNDRKRKANEIEETDNGLSEEIETLKQMINALGAGLAGVLKQSRKQEPRPEKAGLYDRFLYVKRGTQWVNGEPKGLMARADYASVKPLINAGTELYYRTGQNKFELVTKRDQLPTSPITNRPSQLRKIALSKAGLIRRGPTVTRKEDCSSIVDAELCETIDRRAGHPDFNPDWKSQALRSSGLIK